MACALATAVDIAFVSRVCLCVCWLRWSLPGVGGGLAFLRGGVSCWIWRVDGGRRGKKEGKNLSQRIMQIFFGHRPGWFTYEYEG